jgi:hypothetical protein
MRALAGAKGALPDDALAILDADPVLSASLLHEALAPTN